MIFLSVVVLAAALAVLLPKRLDLTLCVAIAMFACVPTVMSNDLVGAGAYFSVPSLFVIVVFGVQFVSRPQEVIRAVESAAGVLSCVLLAALVAVAFTFTSSSFNSLSLVRNQIVVPLLLFVLVRMAMADRRDAGRLMASALIWAGVLNSLVGILVAFRALDQPFLDQLSQNYWYYVGFTRAIGLTDHPLVLSALLVSCMQLLPNLRPRFLQAPVGLVFLVAVVLSASRTGVFVATIGILVLLLSGNTRRGQRALLGVGVVFGGVVYGGALLSTGLAERFSQDQGSAAVRGAAARYVFENWQDYVYRGLGSGGSYSVASAAGLNTSLESPFLMYLVDFSVLAALLYFGTMVAIILMRPGHPRPVAGARLAAAACLISVTGFSSLATGTGLGGVIWFLLAISYVPPEPKQSRSGSQKHTASYRPTPESAEAIDGAG